jgi:hypothetical protein
MELVESYRKDAKVENTVEASKLIDKIRKL